MPHVKDHLIPLASLVRPSSGTKQTEASQAWKSELNQHSVVLLKDMLWNQFYFRDGGKVKKYLR